MQRYIISLKKVSTYKLIENTFGGNLMDIICFELKAANKNCKDKFSEIAKHKYQGAPIFEYACNYVNKSASYKRTGRTLEIIEVKDYSITVKLSSESKLEIASKSLAGFTRELLRIDKELHEDEEKRLFRFFIYNNTLFKNTQILIENESPADMSDVDALKKCVDLFCSGMTLTKEQSVQSAKIKKQIKGILAEYNRFSRIASYSERNRR